MVCDMHCEPGKVSSQPGICPVCRMKLRTWEDVGYAVALAATSPGAPIDPAYVSLRVLDPAGLDTPDVHIDRLTAVSLDLTAIEELQPASRASNASTPAISAAAFFLRPKSQPAMLFAELVDSKRRPLHTRAVSLVPPGSTATPITLAEDFDVVQHDGEYELRVRCNGKKFFAGEPSIIRVGVSIKNTDLADLETLSAATDPIATGSMGQLVVVAVEPPMFARLFPINVRPSSPADGMVWGAVPPDVLGLARTTASLNGGPSDLIFATSFPAPGKYRVFFTAQHRQRPVRASFVIDALPLDPASPAPTSSTPPGKNEHTHPK